MDFTLKIFKNLLQEFLHKAYDFYPLNKYFVNYYNPTSTFSTKKQTYDPTIQPFNGSTFNQIILRHDIDRKPKNALKMAQIEHELGIKASYYFRIVKESNQPDIIKEIVNLGHEIGYHYEDLALANGNYEKAIQSFEKNLEYFRQFYPVNSICMHGSPLSKWDNRKLWDKYDYHQYDIVAETYFDLDFNEIFYITDAGRSWNNEKTSIRDRVNTKFKIDIKSTDGIIKLLKENKLPGKIMFNIHPHNWTDNSLEWLKILLWQGIKNRIKRFIH
ncbi:MAG: hypothetical protein ACTSYZ_13535 [Candidatus Helarchaeota archaeon]